jgi:spermidine synthase
MSIPQSTTIARLGIFLTVFLTGAAVMVIELLGTRLVAPFYGASLYVWSSLISVTLIALAVGYFAGGRWADRARRVGLAAIVSAAGVCTLLIPWLARPVLLATETLGLRGGAFTSALLLFFPSLALLGMVGPFAVKLATSRLEGVGSGAGTIYAVSTVGSVLGTLVLGFFLFPLVGSRTILVGLGLGLLALGLLAALAERRRFDRSLTASALLAALGLGLMPGAAALEPSAFGNGTFVVQSERESLYGWVRVIDEPRRNLRLLSADASVIGAANISDGVSRLGYQDIVGLIPALAGGMKKALLIGQGAGHMATVLEHNYGIATDTLEIDPAVAAAATDWFGFKPSGKAIVGDARYEIRRLQGPYDLIIHDCFTGGSEPTHLLTVEALGELRSLLADGGLIALNFVAFGDQGRNPALASVARTLGTVFPHYRVFAAEPGKDFDDFILLAGMRPLEIQSPPLEAAQADWLRQRAFEVDAGRGTVLTDDFNPLEHLQVRKAEHYREILVEWLGSDLLVR